jgi:hypothetical protein
MVVMEIVFLDFVLGFLIVTISFQIGKRGSIIISKELVEALGIGAKEKFALRKTKAGLALKRAE